MADETTHPIWGPGLKALRRSLYSEQVFDSVVFELKGMHELTPVLKESNLSAVTKDTSFYRNLVVGNMIRLHFLGKDDKYSAQRLMRSTINALYRIRSLDDMAAKIVARLSEDSVIDESWLKLLDYWHSQRVYWLKMAKTSLQKVIPEDQWAQGKPHGSQ